MRGSWLWFGSVGAVLGSPALAWACGGLPDGRYALSQGQPLDGLTGLAVDGPLVFRVDCQTEAEKIAWAVCANERSLLRVSLAPAGSEATPVTGETVPFGDAQVFLPATPLEPDTDYDVHVWLQDEVLPVESGSVERTLRFRSGASVTNFSPAASLRAERYAAPRADCDGAEVVGDDAAAALDDRAICPTGYGQCELAGTTELAHFVLALGGNSGPGAGDLGHELHLMITDRVPGHFASLPGTATHPEWADEPHDLLLSAVAHVPQGGLDELSLDLPAPEDADVDICVRALVTDAAGHSVELGPECRTHVQWLTQSASGAALDRIPRLVPGEGNDCPSCGLDPAATDAAAPRAADAGVPADPPLYATLGDDVVEQRGCSTAPQRGASASAWWWLLALVLPLRARRRFDSARGARLPSP